LYRFNFDNKNKKDLSDKLRKIQLYFFEP